MVLSGSWEILSTSGQPANAVQGTIGAVERVRKRLGADEGMRHFKGLRHKLLRLKEFIKSMASAHNLKVTGSNPVPATIFIKHIK